MNSRQYRIEFLPHLKKYVVRATYGLLDTSLIYAGRTYDKQAEAREAARKHAEDTCVRPIILT